MQIITITGRVGGNAETREAGSSNVTNFNVAVDQGWGNDKTTNWYRVAIWGDRGTKLREHIRKGDKLVVTGELVIGEYNGKPQYEIRAHDVDPFMAPKGDRVPDGSQGAPMQREPVDDLADDVPFISNSIGLEHRVG
jgi:single-strand DNA-binding protein